MLRLIICISIVLIIEPVLCHRNLACQFLEYDGLYECQIFGRENEIMNENEIVAFSGKHQMGKTDEFVTSMAFYETRMYYAPVNLFSQFPNLVIFMCDGCYPKNIDRSTFENAGTLGFISYLMGHTEKLENNLFQGCPNLYFIEIRGHKISQIEKLAFAGLARLESLHLSHNLIVHLEAGIFDDLTSLQTINLNYNRIKVLVPDLFKNNQNLKTVVFASNRILLIEPNLIEGLVHLHYIDFRGNECDDLNFELNGTSLGIRETFKKKARHCTDYNEVFLVYIFIMAASCAITFYLFCRIFCRKVDPDSTIKNCNDAEKVFLLSVPEEGKAQLKF
jgi:hypothetical protein